MVNGKIGLDKRFVRKKPIDDRLYSAFMEHMRDVIYNGIYNPEHPTADEYGFRTDVIELVKELKLTGIRYPGGNFICSYNWEDTVGPVEERPKKVDLAWRQIEPNQVGIPEFEHWTKAVGSELIMAVNLSTRGAADAANLVEYCNHPGGTYYSDLRKKHGHEQPYNIRTWCVGNETDGSWNIARKRAKEYGWDAMEAAKAMRRVDEDIELVAVGSSGTQLDTYLNWDRKVLEQVYDSCDFISLHRYLGNMEIEQEGTLDPSDTTDYLELVSRFERNILDVIAACDYVKGHKRSQKEMYISLDEYNVQDVGVPPQFCIPQEEREFQWEVGTSFKPEGLTMRAVLLFGLTMITLIRHSDRIRIACQSILINGFGMVMCGKDEDAWVNGTYHIFKHCSLHGRGKVLEQVSESNQYKTKSFGDANVLDSVCVYHEAEKEITIFAVNKSEEEMEFTAELSCFGNLDLIEHVDVRAESLWDRNSAEEPDRIHPEKRNTTEILENRIVSKLRGYSWNMIRIKEV